MQSTTNQEKQPPSRGLKQVKVDNWGTFFLQRLQQLYVEEELLDITIKFPTSDITVQAHRLVITTCTDYFTQLERQQKEKNENFDGIIVMPPDMPYECVKSIISFMYTGQLEYWTSEQTALYKTAQKMNMTVLTKLLDAQFNTTALQANYSPKQVGKPVIAVAKSPKPAKKPESSSNLSSSLPSQPLPGRKLPIWKRKLDTSPSAPASYGVGTYHSNSLKSRTNDVTPGPSRFDLPEAEDIALGVFSSFDDITYNTKPIVQASDSSKQDTSMSCKYSSDIDSYNKNDTTEDEDENASTPDKSARHNDSDDDWASLHSVKSREGQHISKKVRFDLEEKENMEKTKAASQHSNTDESITNHAKIIREVLKKYPHLVKNNKNIRLKIMQKESKSQDSNAPAKTKVSYVVLKSDHLMSSITDESETKVNGNLEGGETGPWKCTKCDLDEEYPNYYMFRRHMQDVHGEKFDPRVCEHCGYKATKRNILMYHLYTKHNVPPPKSMCFPKCQSCSYVALSETLLVRHQINHNHRPVSRQSSSTSEEIQCAQCSQTFKDVIELTTHEINAGHGAASEGKNGHRCPHCGKSFVRATNLQIHLDCVHKDLREPPTLEPSSEAEALSNVASGIAASLGVGDEEGGTLDVEENQTSATSEMSEHVTEYIVPEMELNNVAQSAEYATGELGEEGMIMLIDGENYPDHEIHQQPQQLNIAGDEQIVMQGTEDGMIVYIHGNEEQRQEYQEIVEKYQDMEGVQEEEEIVEEVVEEVEEELMEEVEEVMVDQDKQEQSGQVDQIEEVIQYVEYDEEHSSERSNSSHDNQDAVMIIEEEHVEGEEGNTSSQDGENTHTSVEAKQKDFTTEWDEDSSSMMES